MDETWVPSFPRSDRLKILILGLNYAPELTGIGKYTGEMARWLAARGHAVRVVTAPPYYPAWSVREDYRGKGYLTEGGGPAGDGTGEPLVFRCPLYVPSRATGLARVRHLISFAASSLPVLLREVLTLRRGGAPDVVWTVEPTFFCAPLALMAAGLAQAPAWLHVQDFEVDAAFELGLLPRKGAVRNLAMLLERSFSQAFQRVSSISVRMVERSLWKGVPPERIVLFPNWVDVDAVTPHPSEARNPFREQLNLQGKIVLLYSGNMGSKQGLEILPELAAAVADDARLHFVFCGDGAFRPQLEQLSANLPNVTLLPLQPVEALNDLLNCADIHLLPQRADAADLVMPSKLTGMFSSGRPVIATADTETQVANVICGDADGGAARGSVVPADDLPAFAAAVKRLADNPETRSAMGESARRYAVEHLGREQVLEQFERDLQAAITEYRSGRRISPMTPFRFSLVNRRRRRRVPAPPIVVT